MTDQFEGHIQAGAGFAGRLLEALREQVEVLHEQARAAGLQRVQHGRHFRHAAAQAHLQGHTREGSLAVGIGQRGAIADRAAAVARAGRRHRILQAAGERRGGRFGSGLAQEARAALEGGLHLAQLGGDLPALRQLRIHALLALLHGGDVGIDRQQGAGQPRVHEQQVRHGDHRQQQAQREPAITARRLCCHRQPPSRAGPHRAAAAARPSA